jgi:hypothetical protein
VGNCSYITTSEVTTLQHELGNDAMELAALVSETLLTSAESSEVLGGLGDNVVVEVEVDGAFLSYAAGLERCIVIGVGLTYEEELPCRIAEHRLWLCRWQHRCTAP